VLVAETGRQPVDNPDTHLELTMIHEGPLLEYAGRDLALLHWAAAARHWIVLVLAAELFVPHPAGVAGRLAALAAALVGLCVALALTETAQAKMRILRVPGLLALGCLVALVGLGSWIVGATA
jgi:formate hydrogenlyase subunit 4